jgi:hypothetical protein
MPVLVIRSGESEGQDGWTLFRGQSDSLRYLRRWAQDVRAELHRAWDRRQFYPYLHVEDDGGV